MGKHLEAWWLNDMVTLCLALWEGTKVSCRMAVPSCIPTSNKQEFWLLYFIVSICCQLLKKFSHSNRTLVVLTYNSLVKNKHLSYAYLPSVYLLWWSIYSDSFTIFYWVVCFLLLSFKTSLNILDTSPLSDMCFASIFSLHAADF